MRKFYGLAALTLLALGVAFGSGIGRAQPPQEGVVDQAKEKLDEVGRKIKKGLEKAEEEVRQAYHKTRESVQGMEVMARVYARLHWDKALHSSSVAVRIHEGAVILRGAVPNAAAKAKAVTLTAETVGVHKVVDELTVPASEAEKVPVPAQP